MELDERTKLLVAVGASISANCHPCLKYHALKALEKGADESELFEAMEVGKKVRQAAVSGMDRFAASLGQSETASPKASQAGCGCGS